MNKLQSSWELVKASARVLKMDKELVIFPILSSIGLVIVSFAMLLPSLLASLSKGFDESSFGAMSYIVLFIFYLLQYIVIFFSNTALVGAALIRLQGGDPTVKDGFKIAGSRFMPILGYATISATVGMILRMVSEKSGSIGRVIISLVGFAWNVATFLVVPILAVENIGPVAAIKRSVELLKKTWGEQLIGNFGLGAFFGLIFFGLFLIFIPCLFLILMADTISIWAIVILCVVFLLALMLVGLLQSTLNGIYTAAVYQYAVNGQTSSLFDNNMIQNAFKQDTRFKGF
jgi:hypothetical protein